MKVTVTVSRLTHDIFRQEATSPFQTAARDNGDDTFSFEVAQETYDRLMARAYEEESIDDLLQRIVLTHNRKLH